MQLEFTKLLKETETRTLNYVQSELDLQTSVTEYKIWTVDLTLAADNPYKIVACNIPMNNISFGTVGKLSWENGVLSFDGNADESARVFIKVLSENLGYKF